MTAKKLAMERGACIMEITFSVVTVSAIFTDLITFILHLSIPGQNCQQLSLAIVSKYAPIIRAAGSIPTAVIITPIILERRVVAAAARRWRAAAG